MKKRWKHKNRFRLRGVLSTHIHVIWMNKVNDGENVNRDKEDILSDKRRIVVVVRHCVVHQMIFQRKEYLLSLPFILAFIFRLAVLSDFV